MVYGLNAYLRRVKIRILIEKKDRGEGIRKG